MKLEEFGLKAFSREKTHQIPFTQWITGPLSVSGEKPLGPLLDYVQEHDYDYFTVLTTKSIWLQIADGCSSYVDNYTNTFRATIYFDGVLSGWATFLQSKEFWKITIQTRTKTTSDLKDYLLASEFKETKKSTFVLVKRL